MKGLKDYYTIGEMLKATNTKIRITKEVLQDCYSYYAIDAPSELKSMILEAFADALDRFILSKADNIN